MNLTTALNSVPVRGPEGALLGVCGLEVRNVGVADAADGALLRRLRRQRRFPLLPRHRRRHHRRRGRRPLVAVVSRSHPC